MLDDAKAVIKKIPGIAPLLRALHRERFTTSRDYWEHRYKAGKTSGAGSYGRLAEFKALFLNEFVERHNIRSVIEFGSGDGAQLNLAQYRGYTGIDVSRIAIEKCRISFAGDRSKQFFHVDEVPESISAELSLSLDVIYHLVEDSVFNLYMQQLFKAGRRFVIIYSSNLDSDWPAMHVRHRQFTSWVERNEPRWYLDSTQKNRFPYDESDPEQTSFADFYVFAIRD